MTIVAGESGFSGARDGMGTNALFYNPAGLDMTRDGHLVIADSGNNRIRIMSIVDGKH